VEYALRDRKKTIGIAQWQARLIESLPKRRQGVRRPSQKLRRNSVMAGGKKPTLETGGKVRGVRNMKTRPQTHNLGTPPGAIATHETPARQAKSGPKIEKVLPKSLHREIARVHRLAQAAGLFMEDRDLLQCARCGLLEDVGCYGLLMTYPTGAPAVDSGLRFTKDEQGRYICPNCGAEAGREKKGRTTS
jgi:hypothetical protein